MKNRSVIGLVVVLAFVGLAIAKLGGGQAAAPNPGQTASDETGEPTGTPAEQALAAAQGMPAVLCFRSGVTAEGNCVPCVAMADITAAMAPRWAGRAAFIDVSLDHNTSEWPLIEKYQVKVKPTVVLLDREHQTVDIKMGVWPEAELAAELEELTR